MDPFIKLITNTKLEVQTQVHSKGGSNPVWNETLEVPNVSPKDQLVIKCLDQDLGSDDLIGECSIPIFKLCKNTEHWIDIEFDGKNAG